MELRVLPVAMLRTIPSVLGLALVACAPATGTTSARTPALVSPEANTRSRPAAQPIAAVSSSEPAQTATPAAQPVPEPTAATNVPLAGGATTEAPSADLPKGATVLHIGDSFAGALGIELNKDFKEAGVRGILKYETATYIPTWAWGKDLEKYLSKYHPDLVLITLGANELEIPDPSARAPTIKHLVERLAGRPCVWVGPPLWRGARPALLDVIKDSCAPCAYLDSSMLVPDLPRTRDGIHPAMAARKAWADAVVGWLKANRSVVGF